MRRMQFWAKKQKEKCCNISSHKTYRFSLTYPSYLAKKKHFTAEWVSLFGLSDHRSGNSSRALGDPQPKLFAFGCDLWTECEFLCQRDLDVSFHFALWTLRDLSQHPVVHQLSDPHISTYQHPFHCGLRTLSGVDSPWNSLLLLSATSNNFKWK